MRYISAVASDIMSSPSLWTACTHRLYYMGDVVCIHVSVPERKDAMKSNHRFEFQIERGAELETTSRIRSS